MSVRGTIFRAEVFTVAPDEDDADVSGNTVSATDGLSGSAGGSTEEDIVYTTAQTIEGTIQTGLILADGSKGNQVQMVDGGNMVTIRQDAENTAYQGGVQNLISVNSRVRHSDTWE